MVNTLERGTPCQLKIKPDQDIFHENENKDDFLQVSNCKKNQIHTYNKQSQSSLLILSLHHIVKRGGGDKKCA